jgi:hypothetical protein
LQQSWKGIQLNKIAVKLNLQLCLRKKEKNRMHGKISDVDAAITSISTTKIIK